MERSKRFKRRLIIGAWTAEASVTKTAPLATKMTSAFRSMGRTSVNGVAIVLKVHIP